jgi:hypothetical protein
MDWNTMKGRAALSASVVVLLGAVFVVYQFAAKHIFGASLDLTKFFGIVIEPREGVRSAGPQSPIRVVGGSIKLKATGGWGQPMNQCGAFSGFSGQTITNCIFSTASVDFSAFTLIGVNQTPGSLTWTPVPETGLGANWTIIAYARGLVNNSLYQRGVDICVSDGSSCGTGNLIAIAAFDNQPTGNMPASIVGEPVETGDSTLYGYHDPSYNGQPTNLLEYMGLVTVTIGGTPTNYNCIEGICQIYIGN